MPSGTVHERVNLIALLAAAGVRYALSPGEPPAPAEVAFVTGYTIGTLWVTPDLDFANAHPVRALRNWGKLGFLWKPYGYLFRHRGLSHTYLLGPLTRILYLMVLAALLLALVSPSLVEAVIREGPRALPSPLDQPAVWWWGLAGYYVAQWLHLILDGIRPGGRRRKRAVHGER